MSEVTGWEDGPRGFLCDHAWWAVSGVILENEVEWYVVRYCSLPE